MSTIIFTPTQPGSVPPPQLLCAGMSSIERGDE